MRERWHPWLCQDNGGFEGTIPEIHVVDVSE
jgi:hypothetical protein